MQVIAGCAPGGTEPSDDVSALHFLARFDAERRQVTVFRFQAEAVIDDDKVAVAALITGLRDLAAVAYIG